MRFRDISFMLHRERGFFGEKRAFRPHASYMGGGEMISSVKWSESSFAPVPQKFEAGTQNMAEFPLCRRHSNGRKNSGNIPNWRV